MKGCIWADLASSLDSFGLGRNYCTGPFRAWFTYSIISLLSPFDIQFVFSHRASVYTDRLHPENLVHNLVAEDKRSEQAVQS
jgi:hypothetical protein